MPGSSGRKQNKAGRLGGRWKVRLSVPARTKVRARWILLREMRKFDGLLGRVQCICKSVPGRQGAGQDDGVGGLGTRGFGRLQESIRWMDVNMGWEAWGKRDG